MRKRDLLCIAFVLMIGAQFLYVLKVSSQPVLIGKTVQPVPFESNPTANVVTGLSVTNPANAYDGNLTTRAEFFYTGVTGSFEFKAFSTTGVQFSNIAWVDFKISYRVQASTNDTYRIVYYVGTSDPTVLQDWVGGIDATIGKQNPVDTAGIQAHRAWSNQSKPDGSSWSWTDIENIRILFETNLVDAPDSPSKKIFVFEVWLTVYPDALKLPSKSLSVQPQFVLGLTAGTEFFVDVYLSNVTRMLQYEFTLHYDTTVLTAEKYLSYHPFNTQQPSEINDTAGYVTVGYMTFLGDTSGFAGTTPMARIYFQVDADGASALELQEIEAYTPAGTYIPLSGQDGVFATSPVHDVAVTEVTANTTQVMPGSSVSVDVTVSNQGTFDESTSVTVYYNSTPIGPAQPVAIPLGTSQPLSFTWDTTGVPYSHYLIKATADTVLGEADPSDNTLTDGTVIVGRHDVAVTRVIRAYPTPDVAISESETLKVEKGEIVYVNVTVTNEGTFIQTFNVTASYMGGGLESPRVDGAYVFETKADILLNPGTSKNLTFAWDTSTVVYLNERWVECTMRAKTNPIPFEANITNNLFTDQKVNVTRPPIEASFRIIEDTDSRLQGQAITFDAQNSFAVEGTELISFEWSFGDGTNQAFVKDVNLTTPYRWSHVYSQKGVFDVTLKVTNNLSRSDTDTQSLIVLSVDIAVTEITKSATQVKRGEVVNINVTIANEGDFWEDVNVTAYYGNTLLDTLTVQNLLDMTSTELEFMWNTTGVTPGTYTIKANATLLGADAPKEHQKSDNELVDGTVEVTYTRDIRIKSVEATPSEVVIGESVTINVDIENQGDYGSETFTVTVYYDDTEIDTKTVTNLAAGSETTLSFDWDTTGLSPKTYAIRAVATVSGDNDPSDNSFAGNSVAVKEPTSITLYLYIAGAALIAVVIVVLVYFFKVRKPKTTKTT